MEFGRPTILVVSVILKTLLITPEIDFNTAKVSGRVYAIAPWNDGVKNEWSEKLRDAARKAKTMAIKSYNTPIIVRDYVKNIFNETKIRSVTPILSKM